MPSKRDAMTARALALVGCGYIYGATGWVCSLKRRLQQADQYPQYRAQIMGVGAKWDGKICWDCAQLTKACARAAGVALPSGATNQWRSGVWARTGDIASLPRGEPCFLYRRSSSGGGMSHTGLYLGDGTFVHAKGTQWGVLHEDLSRYAWSDWATPWGDPDGTTKEEDETMDVLYRATVTAASGRTVNLRAAASTGSARLASVPVGTVVDVLAEVTGWLKISTGTQAGYMSAAYLVRQKEDTTAAQLDALETRVSALEKIVNPE